MLHYIYSLSVFLGICKIAQINVSVLNKNIAEIKCIFQVRLQIKKKIKK